MHSKTNVKINSMKCRKLSIVAVSVVLFCSCGQQPAQERGPRPVKLAEVASLNKIEKSYSGVVSPDQFSDLAFKMSGPLVAMNVLEGQRVKKGEVVAEIDPTDYKLDKSIKRCTQLCIIQCVLCIFKSRFSIGIRCLSRFKLLHRYGIFHQ